MKKKVISRSLIEPRITRVTLQFRARGREVDLSASLTRHGWDLWEEKEHACFGLGELRRRHGQKPDAQAAIRALKREARRLLEGEPG